MAWVGYIAGRGGDGGGEGAADGEAKWEVVLSGFEGAGVSFGGGRGGFEEGPVVVADDVESQGETRLTTRWRHGDSCLAAELQRQLFQRRRFRQEQQHMPTERRRLHIRLVEDNRQRRFIFMVVVVGAGEPHVESTVVLLGMRLLLGKVYGALVWRPMSTGGSKRRLGM
ncbi:hypothetical protein CPB84DRAFT_1767664 [Gymnopilus junonius]|uniref:Uncharacterized protein n=1 Tax=Gymnopilus junonius TaxID=109634 RepID=A0A9P5NT50_GYMJU|nr:hypothetical protein CPB84DRAFT_1767664 [Gymnopilus junonius]